MQCFNTPDYPNLKLPIFMHATPTVSFIMAIQYDAGNVT